MINYGKQSINNRDVSAVQKALKSDYLTQGPYVKKFEKNLKKYFGASYCTVVSSGTAALHLAGLALGWKKGDIVLVSPISFLASSNCILYSNATPDFVDISNADYNIDINKLEKKIKKLNSKKVRVVGVVVTDYAGNPSDWKSLKKIASKYKIHLINDNCHAIGASYNKDKRYAVKYADIVTHSYHPVKNITTGEGGAILTNDKKIFEKVTMLRSHGITKNPAFMSFYPGPWYYEMHELGYNYRISDMQCSLGISQLKRVNKFIKRRKEIAKIYDNEFSNSEFFKVPQTKKEHDHAYHLYPLLVKFNNLRQKKRLFNNLYKKKINLQVHFIPIHLQPYYKKNFGFKKGYCPIAEKFYLQEISLPIFYSLQKKQIYKIIKQIKNFCEKNL